jgi:hypothetical protein
MLPFYVIRSDDDYLLQSARDAANLSGIDNL